MTSSRFPDIVQPAADEWPIAAAMLQFSSGGSAMTEGASDVWLRSMRRIALEGFTHVEVSSTWLRLGDLEAGRLADFRAVCTQLGLTIPGISVVRESIIHPVHGRRNLAFSHRTIDAAAALAVPFVCFGLHDELLAAQQDALWFWTVAGAPKPVDTDTYRRAVSALHKLGEHAASVGVRVSLELYEDTYLDSGSGATRLLEDCPAVGLNPDVANLVRKQGPVESARSILEQTLPHANYWHVKNIMRLEDPQRGLALTAPAPLESGFIDYRDAVHLAIQCGYTGPFVVEHYGGDGLSVGASNRDYLRRVLSSTLDAPYDG